MSARVGGLRGSPSRNNLSGVLGNLSNLALPPWLLFLPLLLKLLFSEGQGWIFFGLALFFPLRPRFKKLENRAKKILSVIYLFKREDPKQTSKQKRKNKNKRPIPTTVSEANPSPDTDISLKPQEKGPKNKITQCQGLGGKT